MASPKVASSGPLIDHGGEVTSINFGDDRYRCLLFRCPVCRDHHHVIPFEPGAADHRTDRHTHVWANPAGSTVEDLTLRPSYLSTSSRCRVHVYVRGGQLQVLGDTREVTT